jgi:hypothetical protein
MSRPELGGVHASLALFIATRAALVRVGRPYCFPRSPGSLRARAEITSHSGARVGGRTFLPLRNPASPRRLGSDSPRHEGYWDSWRTASSPHFFHSFSFFVKSTK